MTEGCENERTDPMVFETSGSAGEVKRIVHSRAGLEISAAAVNGWLGVDRTSCWGLALPLCHVGGYGVVVRARLAGCLLEEFAGKWQPGRFVDWLAGCRVTHTSLVPTQVFDLVASGLGAPAGLRAVVVGGGRLDEATGRRARELGWPVLPSYGLTEAGSQVATAGLDELGRPYREGPLPVLPIWQLRSGDDGRLWLRGEALFIGWLVGEERRFEARRGEWFETSDLVEISSGGGIIPLGRADTRIKVLGELVDPLAIERELERIDPAAGWGCRAVVLGLPDERAGHRLVVVTEGGPTRAMERAVASHNSRSPGFARVSGVLCMEEFPRGGMGKVRRGEMAARIGQGRFSDSPGGGGNDH